MLFALAGASVLALSTGANAQTAATAQTAAPAESSTLGEVIVTARRRTEVLQDVPVSINAVTSQELAKLNIREFEDITSVVADLDPSGLKICRCVHRFLLTENLLHSSMDLMSTLI